MCLILGRVGTEGKSRRGKKKPIKHTASEEDKTDPVDDLVDARSYVEYEEDTLDFVFTPEIMKIAPEIPRMVYSSVSNVFFLNRFCFLFVESFILFMV